MPRPRQISDERILSVARRCFLEHGGSVSTATIAKRIGVSQAVLFQRFATKEELVRAALTPQDPVWVTLATCGPDERPVRAQLLELGSAIHGFFVEMTPAFEVLRSCGPHPRGKGEPPPFRSHRALAGWFERAAKAGLLGPHDPGPVALAFLGALQARAWFRYMGHKTLADDAGAYVATVVDLFLPALAPRPRRKKASR